MSGPLSSLPPSLGRAESRPHFFYTNAVYDQAYKTISNALRARKGLVVLTGEAGTGKTKLMRLMSTTLEEQIRLCLCTSPPTTLWELLAIFDDLLVLPDRGSEIPLKLDAITDRLRMWAYCKGTTALVLEDAHTLNTTVLDHLSLLLDLNTTFGPLLQIVLVGRPELEEKLAAPELRHIHERIAVRSRLTPLYPEEVRTFIHQRYRTARGLRQYLFTAEAIDRIAVHSQAIPARITLLSEGALIAAYAQGHKVVTPETVEDLAAKLFAAPAREPVPLLPAPTSLPSLTPDHVPQSSGHRHALRHVHLRIVRFSRAFITIGLCAVLLLAGLLIGKYVPTERLAAALPVVIEKTKKTLAFFPGLLFADSVPPHQGRYQQPLPQRSQHPTDIKPHRR